ncbi:hypothetical protein ACFL20_06745 [Spirochaetota bacterium]
MEKINFTLDNLGEHSQDALYYIFLLIESHCLNVDLNVEKDIKDSFESQKNHLTSYNSEIIYAGPDLSKYKTGDINYIFSFNDIKFKHQKYIHFYISCFEGIENHGEIAKKNGISDSIQIVNGLRICKLLYGGTLSKGKFSDHSVTWNSIVRYHMPGEFNSFGKIINRFMLNHFGIEL